MVFLRGNQIFADSQQYIHASIGGIEPELSSGLHWSDHKSCRPRGSRFLFGGRQVALRRVASSFRAFAVIDRLCEGAVMPSLQEASSMLLLG